MGVYFFFTLFVVVIQGMLAADVVRVLREGDLLTLKTDVIKQERDIILWYFNDTLIALINKNASKSCLHDGKGGRFRDRLEVDYESGSLTIKNITTEHTGVYEAEIIRRESARTSQSLNRKPKCDSTKVIQKTCTIGQIIKTCIISLSGPVKTDEELNINGRECEYRSLIAGVCAAFLILIAAIVAGVIYFHRGSSENADREK